MIGLGMAYNATVIQQAPDGEDVPTLLASHNNGLTFALLGLNKMPWNGPLHAVYVLLSMLASVSAEDVATERMRGAKNGRFTPRLVNGQFVTLDILRGDMVPSLLLVDGRRWRYAHGHHDSHSPAFCAFYYEEEVTEEEVTEESE